MSIYEAAAGLLAFGFIFTSLGVYIGTQLERMEWQEKIEIAQRNPRATQQQLDLIFRLDQRK